MTERRAAGRAGSPDATTPGLRAVRGNADSGMSWEDPAAWRRVYGMRHHASGWIEYCEDGDDPGSDATARVGSLDWQEVGEQRDEWMEGCTCGFLLGVAATSALCVWLLFS